MKTALIVDDSRLARTVLSRLLAENGVAADEVPSAEQALGYLKERRPDVVFLDHNMPGMDGLEALEAIKANPVTATIPVMMYTSQEGQLYLGQARALGAIGVLPKSLRPAEVTTVLRSLHLLPHESAVAQTPAREAPRIELKPLDTQRMKALIEELFYEQAAVLREEIRKEFQRERAHAAPPTPPPPLAPPEPERPVLHRLLSLRPLRVASVLLLALAVTLGYLYYRASAVLDETTQQARRLANDTAALSNTTAWVFNALRRPETAQVDLLDMLQWAANRGVNYAFDAIPLDDERAAEFAALLEHLDRFGFTGTVVIDVHVGRYCMNYGSDGTLQLAPTQQLASVCEQVGWPEPEALAMGNRQSVAFANAIAAATRGGQMRVETIPRGTAEPAVAYPLPGYDVTAGEWNEIAARNHRIAVRLEPDPTMSRNN